jgi:hypothetical protein
MGLLRRNYDRRPGRKQPFRDPKPIILIVCEGDITEPEYFEGLIRECQNPRVTIEIEPGQGVPKSVVDFAKQRKREAERAASRQHDENIAFDSVWCVFDVDDHPNLQAALQNARDADIEVALSNPCFELWLLIHFRDSPGMQHRSRIVEMLCEYVPGYSKHVEFALFADHYDEAKTRAQRMYDSAEQDEDFGRNPLTSVHKLTEEIRSEQ